MDFTTILIYGIIVLVTIFLLFSLYNHYTKTKLVYYDEAAIIENRYNAAQGKVINSSQIPSPLQGNEYAVSFWIYLNDYTYKYGQIKHILFRGVEKDDKIEANPHIYLHPTESTIMVRVKLQSNTVPDPNAHLKKVTVPGSEGIETEKNLSNISGNNETGVGNNVIETFYSSLGNNILDGQISTDDMSHNYSLVGAESTDQVDNHQFQMKELFEGENNHNNSGINGINGVNNINGINGINGIQEENITSNNIDNQTDSQLSLPADFMNNPFMAEFIDKYSKSQTSDERQNVAVEYADKFTDKDIEQRKQIANHFLKTVAKMFASTMGLEIVNNDLMSPDEINIVKKEAELYDTCYLRDVPLQRWTNVIVSVYQNSLDIYKDGKLTSSCNLKGFPKPNKNPVHITPHEGFNGFLSNTKFLNLSVTPEKAMELYKEGPSYTKGFFGTILDKMNK